MSLLSWNNAFGKFITPIIEDLKVGYNAKSQLPLSPSAAYLKMQYSKWFLKEMIFLIFHKVILNP